MSILLIPLRALLTLLVGMLKTSEGFCFSFPVPFQSTQRTYIKFMVLRVQRRAW